MKVLLTIHGMGDPETDSSIRWAEELFETEASVAGEVEGSKVFKIESEDEPVYILEIFYDDWNQLFYAKREAMDKLLSLTPDLIKKPLECHVADVLQVVFTDATRQTNAMQVLEAYTKALKFVIQQPERVNFNRDLKIGMLCHSLGTYLIYEGCNLIANTNALIRKPSCNVVLCAPMLSPIQWAQDLTQIHSFLTKNGNKNPNIAGGDKPFVNHCLALYNEHDPFYLIQKKDYYTPAPGHFVTDFKTYKEGAPYLPGNHEMSGSYIKHNREKIIEALWR